MSNILTIDNKVIKQNTLVHSHPGRLFHVMFIVMPQILHDAQRSNTLSDEAPLCVRQSVAHCDCCF